MTFRLQLPIELERPGGALAESVRVEVDVLYQAGRWRAQCRKPPVSTSFADSLEAALVAVVKEINREWQVDTAAAGGVALL